MSNRYTIFGRSYLPYNSTYYYWAFNSSYYFWAFIFCDDAYGYFFGCSRSSFVLILNTSSDGAEQEVFNIYFLFYRLVR